MSNLKRYLVSWTGGRPVNSLRAPLAPFQGGGSMVVEAESPKKAIIKVYDHYEHIYTVKVEETR